MAEIKSTLDLIMERTKHLTLSPEEKEALKMKELRTRIGATIQKYLDGAETLSGVTETLQRLSQENGDVTYLMREEIIERIDPREENLELFQLIKEILPGEEDFFRKKINLFAEELSRLKLRRREEILNAWARSALTGPALEPNLERDENWQKLMEESLSRFREEFRRNPQH